MQLCIILLLVVWFEFEFVEFKFKLNLLNLFVKRKNRKNLFGPNQQSGLFLFLTRKTRIASPSLYKHPLLIFVCAELKPPPALAPTFFLLRRLLPAAVLQAPQISLPFVLHAVHLHLPCALRCCLPCTCQVPCCLHPPCRKHRCPTLHACFSSGPRTEQAAAVPSGFNSGHYDSSLLWVNSKMISSRSHCLSHRIVVLAPFSVFLALS